MKSSKLAVGAPSVATTIQLFSILYVTNLYFLLDLRSLYFKTHESSTGVPAALAMLVRCVLGFRGLGGV